MTNAWNRFWNTDESGQGLVEYALLVALVALGVIAGVIAFRNKISTIFSNATTQLPS